MASDSIAEEPVDNQHNILADVIMALPTKAIFTIFFDLSELESLEVCIKQVGLAII